MEKNNMGKMSQFINNTRTWQPYKFISGLLKKIFIEPLSVILIASEARK